MNARKNDIIIFTGQSGIKLESCINKLASTGLDSQFVTVDKAISEISGKKFVEVLGTPPSIQDVLWTQAFKHVINILQSKSAEHELKFLTFHACYYHQRKTEFVCPVNLNELVQLKDRAKMIIVLIDDCYDIYRRLMGKDQMYEYVLGSDDSLDTLLESICNLTDLLTWRETEIAFSRKIAQLLDVPMYVISVKHPDFMISRLISAPRESLKILYLSHPISVIRRQGISPRLPEFYAQLSHFIQDVLKYDGIVLFVPDTIDEYRIKENNGGDLYIPELLDGWLLPFSDKWLYEPLPAKLAKINPLNPTQYKYSAASPDAKVAISSTLRILNKRIGNQINSRDRTLVEQSKDGILVYRPYLAASTHFGVEEEMIHNCDLRDDYGEKERKTYIITTQEDLGKLRIKKLFTLIEHSANITNTEDISSLQELCEQWLADPKKVLEFYSNSYDINETREAIEKVLPTDYRFVKDVLDKGGSLLSAGKMLQKAEQKKRGWSGIFRQVAEEDPLIVYSSKEDILLSSQDRYDEETKDFIRDVIASKSREGKSEGE
jgi:hypothetical protein